MPHFVHMSRETVETWKNFTRDAVKLLHVHHCLLDSYVLDFFSEDLWSQINPKWSAALDNLTCQDLASFLCCDANLSVKTAWPLSLLAMRAAAFTYALPRKSVSSINQLESYLSTQTRCDQSDCGVSYHGEGISLKPESKLKDLPDQNITESEKILSANRNICSTQKQYDLIGSAVSVVKENDLSYCVDKNIGDNTPQENLSVNIKGNTQEEPMETCSVNSIQQNVLKLNSRAEKVQNKGSPLPPVAVKWGDATSELSAAAGQHKLLQHVFRRHLKPKKQHEIARLALVAGHVCRAAGVAMAVDVGAGQGHLSRLLAYGHSIKVVCLEAEDEFIAGAQKFDLQLEQAVEKMKHCESSLLPLPPAPRHTVCHLHPNMSPQVFTEVVCGAWESEEDDGAGCGLLGLHTCGDLGPTLLRLFTHTPSCQALVSVGCCYMKLTSEPDSNPTQPPGYPMSQFVHCLPGHTQSYTAREVSCHAIEMYASRLQDGADKLKIHCYRACLEEIIVKHWPHHYHAGLRSVNRAHTMDFPKYAVEAISRLEDVKELPEDDLFSCRTQQNLSRWMQVVVYYSLRLLLAPVVETVILLDRLFFLHENGVDGLLFPAFDPELSPRNHVLVAVKPKNKTLV